MIPVNARAFGVSQQSAKRLNALYRDGQVVHRDGSCEVIDAVERLGLYGDSPFSKLLSLLFGTRHIKVRFRPVSLSLPEFKQMVSQYLPRDLERGGPHLPPERLREILAGVAAADAFERAFDALRLPDPEDCLDGL